MDVGHVQFFNSYRERVRVIPKSNTWNIRLVNQLGGEDIDIRIIDLVFRFDRSRIV